MLPPGAARVTHLAPPAARLEDIPPKTGDMIVAEMSCRRVVDGKEKKKRKVEEKAATKAPGDDIQVEAAVAKAAGREGPPKPLEALPNEEHVSPPLSVGQMGTLRDQIDEHAISPRVVYTSKLIVEEGEKGDADASPALEGHGDNEDGLSGLQIRPSSVCPSGMVLRLLYTIIVMYVCVCRIPLSLHFIQDILEEPAPEKFVPDAEASALEIFLLLLNRGLQTQVVWTTRVSQDMMANLFTPTDEEFLNEGVRDESTIRWSWKMLCQSAQQQANVLLRFEALKEQHADLVYTHESCTNVKACFKECRRELATVRLEELEEEKKEADNLNSSQADRIKQLEETLKQAKADAEQLRSEKVHYVVEARKGEIVRQKIVNQYLPTFVRRLHQSAEYKRSLG
ncbi:hypothetical protein Tco_0618174 [Tanacetum coccineum]